MLIWRVVASVFLILSIFTGQVALATPLKSNSDFAETRNSIESNTSVSPTWFASPDQTEAGQLIYSVANLPDPQEGAPTITAFSLFTETKLLVPGGELILLPVAPGENTQMVTAIESAVVNNPPVSQVPARSNITCSDAQETLATATNLSTVPLWGNYIPVGEAFVVRAIDSSGTAIEGFGIESEQLIETNTFDEVVQFETDRASLDVVIRYDDTILKGLDETSLALFSYDTAKNRWAKLVSFADTEQNELKVVFHTLNSNLFRLGAAPLAVADVPLIVLDPDANLGRVTETGYAAQEGTYNVETALDIEARLQNCNAVTVSLTHTDRNAPGSSRTNRAQIIAGLKPDAALTIGYDVHLSYMQTGSGGSKTYYGNTSRNATLANRVLESLYAIYPYIHGSCPNGRCVLYNYSRTSVEKDVYELDSSIPIIRVEVGYLSLYQNRAWIERDFGLPSNERQIPYMLANALLEFLGQTCTFESLCGEEERPGVENTNYSNTNAAQRVTENIVGAVESRREAVVETQSYMEDGLVLDTTPSMIIPTSILSNVQTLDTFEGITVTPYITGNETITFTLPVDWLYRMSALLSASGGITTVTPLSFTTSLSVPTQFLDIISMTMGIGTCHGLMTWLSRHCAEMEPLGLYGVDHLDQLDVNNSEFMQRVIWYQLVQLTEEFYNAALVLTPTTMQQELARGLHTPYAPSILTLVPDADSVSCEEGHVPTGHTLFIIDYDAETSELVAVDPNVMAGTIRIRLTEDRWIYENAPYSVDSGDYTWTGEIMYAWSPIGVPPFGEFDAVNWIGLETVSDTLLFDGLAIGVRSRGALGGTPGIVSPPGNTIRIQDNLWAVSGVRSRGALGGTEQDKCVPLAFGQVSRPLLPGNLILPVTNHVLELRGAMRGSAVGTTLFNNGNATTLYASANASTVNHIGVSDAIRTLTMTTNMAEQDWASTFFRAVDAGRTNRIFALRHTTLQDGEVLGVGVSLHNNMFTLDNSQGNTRSYDISLETVGWAGHTSFRQDAIAVQAGSVQTITVWDWDLLNVTPIFMYEDTDGDGVIDNSTLLQDKVRPTRLRVGSPSYISDTVTYLTPDTTLSFDVMKATCGISATLYSINGAPFEVYTTPFTLNGWADGIYTLAFYSVDGIGNVEPTNVVTLHLYSTPPELTLTLAGDLGADGWYTPPVTTTLHVTLTVLPLDAARVQCKRNTGAWERYTLPYVITQEIVHHISCVAADVAGFASPVQTVVVPIRSAGGNVWKPGNLGLSPAMHKAAYTQIVREALGTPGKLRWALDEGLCQGLPMQAGDFCLFPTPLLGIPPELEATWTITRMLAMQGGGIAVFNSPYAWESGHAANLLHNYLGLDRNIDYTLVRESDLRQATGLEGVKFLILPSTPLTATEAVTSALESTGLAYLAEFVRNGGTVYAVGPSIRILEAAGLITDVLAVDQSIEIVGEIASIHGVQPENPLTFNWLTSRVYLPQNYVLNAGDALTAIALYSDTNAPGTPAMLHGQIGQGQLVLVNHNIFAANDTVISSHTSLYPPFINALLLALAEPAALIAQAQQLYDPAVDYDLFPAGKAGIPIRLTVGLDWLDEALPASWVLTETIPAGFVVDPAENPSWLISSDGDATQMVRSSQTETMFLGHKRQTFTILVRTSTTALLAGDVIVARGKVTIVDTDGAAITLSHPPVRVRALLPAETFWHKRVWPEVLQGIPATGADLNMTVGVVNWHDTPAYHLMYTETLPLWTPMLDASLQTPLTDTQGRTVWGQVVATFPVEPLPDQARYKGQSFSWADWDGKTVYTLTLPAGVHIQLPDNLPDEGCDSPFADITCCQGNTGFGNAIQIIRTPTQTLVILPAIVFTWHLDDLNGYEYRDPVIYYHLKILESRRREVRFVANYDPYDQALLSEPGIAFLYQNGAFWAALGHVPLGLIHVPERAPVSPHTLGANVQDLWGRVLTATTPARFVSLIAPLPTGGGEGTGASEVNITSAAWADMNGDGELEGPLTDVPADRPVRACVYTALQDWGRSNGQTGTLILRFPWGLGYQIRPENGDWGAASQSLHGYAVYSDTLQGDGEDWVRFRVNLNTGQREWITTCLEILPYPGITHEGYRTFFDGALYHYPFDVGTATPIDHLSTAYIQAAWAVMHNPALALRTLPLKVGRTGDTLYYMATPRDINAERPFNPYIYIATYGGETFASTTYLGGTLEGTVRDPKLTVGDQALARIELSNNTGITWTDVTVQIKPDIPGILVEPYQPSLAEPGALNERPHLGLSTIADVGWGVYYYRVQVTPAYTGALGHVITLPVLVSGNHIPVEMVVPPIRLAVVDASAQAVDPVGVAHGVTFDVRFADYYAPTHCALATTAQVNELTGAWYASSEAAAQVYNTLPPIAECAIDTLSETLYLNQTRLRTPFPALADKLPAEDSPYTVVISGAVAPLDTEQQWLPLDINPTLIFTDHFGYATTFNQEGGEIATGGPILQLRYHGIPTTTLTTVATVRASIHNVGDDIAQNGVVSLTFPVSVTVTPLAGDCRAPVQIGAEWVLACNIKHLSPYDRPDESIAFMLEIPPSSIEQSTKRSNAPVFGIPGPTYPLAQRAISENVWDTLFQPATARYLNAFTERWEQATLPIAAWRTDLVISQVWYTPPDPIQYQPAVISITLKNTGPDTIFGDFWVDLYINPTSTVGINIPWHNVCQWGIAWKVYTDLKPGDSVTLSSASSGDILLPGPYSHWDGHFPMAGEVQIAVLVDSYGDLPTGAVSEVDETNNLYRFTVTVAPGYRLFLPLTLRQWQ